MKIKSKMDNTTFIFFGISILALIVAFIALLISHIHRNTVINTFNEMQMDINDTLARSIYELSKEIAELKRKNSK